MYLSDTMDSWRTTIDSSGRLHIPIEARKRYGLEVGAQVVLFDDDQGSMRLLSLDEFTRNIQEYFLSLEPSEVSWTEELLRERKEEAAREASSN